MYTFCRLGCVYVCVCVCAHVCSVCVYLSILLLYVKRNNIHPKGAAAEITHAGWEKPKNDVNHITVRERFEYLASSPKGCTTFSEGRRWNYTVRSTTRRILSVLLHTKMHVRACTAYSWGPEALRFCCINKYIYIHIPKRTYGGHLSQDFLFFIVVWIFEYTFLRAALADQYHKPHVCSNSINTMFDGKKNENKSKL